MLNQHGFGAAQNVSGLHNCCSTKLPASTSAGHRLTTPGSAFRFGLKGITAGWAHFIGVHHKPDLAQTCLLRSGDGLGDTLVAYRFVAAEVPLGLELFDGVDLQADG